MLGEWLAPRNASTPSTVLLVFSLLLVTLAGMGHSQTNRAQDPVPRVAIGWTRDSDGAGIVQGLQATAPWTAVTSTLVVGPEPVLRAFDASLVALSPDDGTVRLIDVATWTITQTHALGTQAPPVDIAIVTADRTYVTRGGTTQLLRLDLTTGATQEVVDLAPYADSDGDPDMGTMIHDAGRLFIQLRRRDNNGVLTDPLLAVVDLASETLVDADPTQPGVQAIALQGTAPKGKMQLDSGRLLVSATGGLHDAGGIEVVDPTTLESQGFVVDEMHPNAGADTGAFVLVEPDFGYFSFSTDFAPSSHLHTFTIPSSGTFGPELQTTLLYVVPHFVHDPTTQLLFWPEGGWVDPGVLVFDAVTGTRLTETPVPTSGLISDLELVCVGDCAVVRVEEDSWSGLKKRFR